MKLSDYKGEDAIELLANILEPTMEIVGDPIITESIKDSKKMTRGALIKTIIKDHKKPILEILAYINGEDPASYEPDILTLTMSLIELFNDEAFLQLFPSQDQSVSDLHSGPAMADIQESAT